MKDLYIVANWKANKTTTEALEWLAGMSSGLADISSKKIIVCSPFISVATVSEFVKSNNLPIEVGAQDVSAFPLGAYTGEVPAALAAKHARYSIIGHSERRQNLGENDEVLQTKVKNAQGARIEPIFCIQNENTPVPAGVRIVAYEPIEAIGTGNPDTPEDAERVARAVKEKNGQVEHVLYGGSVTSENVSSFTKMDNISGVLVGGASLDPEEFSSIIKQC